MTDWRNLEQIGPHSFDCGYCGRQVSSREGYYTDAGYNEYDGNYALFICPGCNRPSFFCGLNLYVQTPSPRIGNDVADLPVGIKEAYEEARDCTKVKANTACVLICRKLLMHIAVECGAEEGKSFLSYVEFLSENGYVPPNGKGWVDHIRKKGNEANHEIVLMSRDDAEDLIIFLEMLLKFIYEFPARIAIDEVQEE